MKKKMNLQMLVLLVAAILSAALLVSLIYYEVFQQQVKEELKTCVQLWEEYGPKTGNGGGVEGLRITCIDKNGKVTYDSLADITELENHKDRPEIIQAMEEGEGLAVRISGTFDRSTFYYAKRLEDGSVLRAAKETDSLYSIMLGALPGLVLVVGVLILAGMLSTHILTRKLIAPIENLTENSGEDEEELPEVYPELVPLLQKIRQQHKDILQNARMRQEFTANVSHELKTPLTAISGYAELIEAGMASPEDAQRFAAGIHKNSDRLLTLINDIIRLSQLDGPNEETTFERLNLYELARNCVDNLQMNAAKHHVTVSLQGKDCFLMANRQMMEELLYNLCDNAIRYNRENGSVLVEVAPTEENAMLRVSDTGIGISKEHQERIFERFYRVDKSRSKSTGGTGLGLAIVKHIIAIHKAKLDLKSEKGKGTQITVLFPKEENIL